MIDEFILEADLYCKAGQFDGMSSGLSCKPFATYEFNLPTIYLQRPTGSIAANLN